MEVDDPAVYYAPAPQPTLPSPYQIALAAAAAFSSSRPPAPAPAPATEGAKKKEKKPRYRADAFLKARRQDKALKSRNPRQLRKRYKAAERGELCGPLVPLCVCVCVVCVVHHFARVWPTAPRVWPAPPRVWPTPGGVERGDDGARC